MKHVLPRAALLAFAAMLSATAFLAGPGQAGAAEVAIAVDDDYTVAADDVLTVAAPGMLGNDTVPAGDSYKRIGDANHNADNSFSTNGAFSYTPDAGFAGEDSYTYCITASAFTGDCLSNVATIHIHVVGPAVAVDDEYTTQAGTQLTVPATGFLSNDTGLAASPNFVTFTTFQHSADFDLNGDGSVAYTPQDGFTGDDSATYCITVSATDHTCVSDHATVLIHVVAAPESSDPPTSEPPSSDAPTDPTAIETTDDQLPVITSSSAAGLAATGFETGAWTLAGLLVVLAGCALVGVSRRHRGRHA
jgi:large repetitive protein